MDIKKLLMGSAFYSIGNMGGAGLNMLYQFVLMLFLTTNDYGIIQPLLQFIGLLILPVSAYQYALTKHYGDIPEENIEAESLYRIKRFTVITLLFSVLWIILIPILSDVFHVENTNLFLLLLISLIFQMIQAPFLSRLQAERHFFIAGAVMLVQGIVRITLGVVIVWLIPNVLGAMMGILLSNIAMLLGNTFPYRKQLKTCLPKDFKAKSVSLRLLFVSLGSVGLFSLLMYSDTVLVRSVLPDMSGLFASSNLLGKGMIFLTAGISFVVLPLMSGTFSNPKKSLWVGFFVLLILVFSYIIFFAVTGGLLGQILFQGDSFIMENFTKYLNLYNIMFLPYPLIYYFLNYYLVQESFFYPVLLFFANIFLFTGIFMFHQTLFQIIYVIGVVGYSTLLVVFIHSIISKDEGMIHGEQIDEASIENLI